MICLSLFSLRHHRQEEREAMLRAFDEQMADKERRRQEALAQEQQYRRELLAYFAEQERLEQLSEQKRRLKVKEHLRQVRTSNGHQLITTTDGKTSTGGISSALRAPPSEVIHVGVTLSC